MEVGRWSADRGPASGKLAGVQQYARMTRKTTVGKRIRVLPAAEPVRRQDLMLAHSGSPGFVANGAPGRKRPSMPLTRSQVAPIR
jgi:hypothetical protein